MLWGCGFRQRIAYSAPRDKTSRLFVSLNFLKLHDLITMCLVTFTFSLFEQAASFYTVNNSVHNNRTRQSSQLHTVFVGKDAYNKRSLKYSIWIYYNLEHTVSELSVKSVSCVVSEERLKLVWQCISKVVDLWMGGRVVEGVSGRVEVLIFILLLLILCTTLSDYVYYFVCFLLRVHVLACQPNRVFKSTSLGNIWYFED